MSVAANPLYVMAGGQRRRMRAVFDLDCIHGMPLLRVCRECAPIPQIEGGRMTPEQFGFFVRGLVSAAMPNAEMTRMVLDAAREHLTGARVAQAAVPALKMLKVPAFCLHNLSVQESCAACPAGGRLFGFHLPHECRAVYIAHTTNPPAAPIDKE